MRPTALGLKALLFLAGIVTAFFVSPYTNLFFLLLAFLCVMLSANLVWTVTNLRAVEVRVARPRPGPAGTPMEFEIALDDAADRPRVRFRIDVVLVTEDGDRHVVAEVPILRRSRSTPCRLGPLPRGVYRLAPCLQSTYPLGFVRARSRVAEDIEVVVHPRPVGDEDRPDAQDAGIALLDDDAPGERAGRVAPSGLRPWADGDSLRDVHWRATARRGVPVVREFDGGAGEGVHVVLDRRCDAAELEGCLSLVTTLAMHARDRKEPLALSSQEIAATFGEGQASIADLLRWLAAAQTVPTDGPPPAASIPAGAIRLPAVRQHAPVPAELAAP